LTFTPNASGLPANFTNPQVVFANGTKTATINVAAGSTAPWSLPAVQVGSVAGTITVRLATLTLSSGESVLPSNPVVGNITVARGIPVITPGSVRITSITATGFSVVLQGLSTPRDLSTANLTFTPASGATLNGAAFPPVTLTPASTNWFADTAAGRGVDNGGRFTLTIPFNYSGDTNALGTVSVTLTNSVGTSTAVSGGR
jgi:hypothetical protein